MLRFDLRRNRRRNRSVTSGWRERDAATTPSPRSDATPRSASIATGAPSIWSPATLILFDRFYGALGEHFGDRIREIYVSLVCDYGEVGYPVGMADRIVHSDHVHPGFWCGGDRARVDFREKMVRRYGTLDALNRAWGTAYSDPEEIDYPPRTATQGPDFDELEARAAADRGCARRRWLDFVDWYLESMLEFTRNAVAVSRRHFPGIPHEIKIGHGVDITAYLAHSRTDGYTVRSTHGKLRPHFYRRFSNAAKYYGVPLVTEPPSGVTRTEEVERIFKDATSGTTEFFDYPKNLLDAADLFRRYGPYMEGRHSLCDIAFFLPTTDHRLRPAQANPERIRTPCAAARDFFDCDILDERLIRDGAPSHYRLLVLAEGNGVERDVLERIEEWVTGGGFLVSAAFGPIETVEGDDARDRRLFVSRDALPETDAVRPAAGSPLPACRIDVGAASAAGTLIGDWHPPESGHWEWGGEPGAILKRWTGGRAGIRIPVDPGESYRIALAVARHPKRLNDPCDVFVNGVRIGAVDPQRASVFRGSTDRRRLGVAVRWVKCWSGDGPEPEAVPLPRLSARPALETLRERCLNRLGNGATILTPFGADRADALAALVSHIVYHPEFFVPGRRGAPEFDGAADGVWTALMPNRVLLYNGCDRERARAIRLQPERLARAGARAPAAETEVSVTIPPHGVASVEFPDGRVSVP